jgi:hypothetical protein
VFSQPQVKELLERYVLVQLYTDGVPAGREQPIGPKEAAAYELKRFDENRLPLYGILEPDGGEGRVVGKYTEGKINDVEGFKRFLRQHLGESAAVASRGAAGK